MGTLEDVLRCILAGKRDAGEIAKELGTSVERVEDAIQILKSLGYIEEVEKGSDLCSTCPLRKVCGGSCVIPRTRAYLLTEKSFTLKDHSQ